MNRLSSLLRAPRSGRLLLSALGALLLGLLVVGCANPTGAQTVQLPLQASEQAKDSDWMFMFIYWLNLFYFVHIMGVMGWFMWRYRRRPGVEPEPSPHHSLVLEIAWSLPPVLLCAVMFYWGWTGYMDLSTPPADAYKIEARAKKWDWTFVYPNGGQSDELHVPPNEPVEMIMTSADVLHAFYIPKFRVKKDIVPGKVSGLWFTATRPGKKVELDQSVSQSVRARASEYKLYCAEYCGTNHSQMWAPVVVHETRADFEKWVGETRKMDPAKLYKLNCASCHNVTGAINVGPTFKGLFNSKRKVFDPETGKTTEIVADEAYLRESILYPGVKLSRVGKDFDDQMSAQGFREKLKPEEVDMLIEFLKDPEKAMGGGK